MGGKTVSQTSYGKNMITRMQMYIYTVLGWVADAASFFGG